FALMAVRLPPTAMRPYVILNPIAGSAADGDGIRKQLSSLDPLAICTTGKPGHAAAFARRAVRDKCKYIIAAGGDGTLNEVINGVARHTRHIRVGLLPLGTGNDFARSLKLPATVEENIAVLRADRKSVV